MADLGTTTLDTDTAYEVTGYVTTLGMAYSPVSMDVPTELATSEYSIGGTSPCPQAPLVGQWWPR